MYTYIYIYICGERERYTHIRVYTYIYIYIGKHGLFWGKTQGPYTKQNHVNIWCLSDV